MVSSEYRVVAVHSRSPETVHNSADRLASESIGYSGAGIEKRANNIGTLICASKRYIVSPKRVPIKNSCSLRVDRTLSEAAT